MSNTVNTGLHEKFTQCTKDELQKLLETFCMGNKLVTLTSKIILNVDVDNSVAAVKHAYNKELGTVGFTIGDSCFYENEDVEEIKLYFTNLFKTVMGPLIKYQKYAIVTEFFKELYLIKFSMYGPGGSSCSYHIEKLLLEYWNQILTAQGSNAAYQTSLQDWFNSSELQKLYEDYGDDEFLNELLNYGNKQKTHTPAATLVPAYVKKFMYLKPNQQIPEKREVLILADNGSYIQGIDFKYLSDEQKNRCMNELEGKEKVSLYVYSDDPLSRFDDEYEDMESACRVFKKDRIVYENI